LYAFLWSGVSAYEEVSHGIEDVVDFDELLISNSSGTG
jgi:hypothetical protein